MSLLIASETELVAAPEARAAAPAIKLEGVSVEYRAPQERISSFKEYAIRLLQGRVQHKHFHALREVNLEVKPGEVFGVIGRNGAGKSTLLKVISRVMRPTRGRVVVRGRLAPLLELGAGFHHELTGRENIFLNGTLLGFTHAQVEELFDEIVDFAELREFIDAPLRTYSTGMVVRLGFAVATAVRPDVLLVDEVLSVGDERFQEKCAARITEFRQNGATILLVTHDTRLALSMCNRAVWLDHGQVAACGEVTEVVHAYHNKLQRSAKPASAQQRVRAPRKTSVKTPGTLTPETAQLEELALLQNWFYDFELPSGRHTPCLLAPDIAQIHETRWEMLYGALDALCQGDWSQLSCLDLGCAQGYFAVKLAQQGCARVIGVDARAGQVRDADLMRRIYGLNNLQFRQLDLTTLNPLDFPRFDVVLLFGLLYQLENPLGALRLARTLADRAVLVETQLAPDLEGRMQWGSATQYKHIEGSFALLDRSNEGNTPYGSLTPFSLCPGRKTLLWAMEQLGFARVEVLPPPPNAYEQLASGQRIMVAGYL